MISDAQQKTYESRPSRSTTEKPNYYLSRPARGLKISLPARDSELSTKIGLEEKRKTSEVPHFHEATRNKALCFSVSVFPVLALPHLAPKSSKDS